jgi:hypothetical protein
MTASALRADSRLRDHREGLVVERHEARPTTTAATFDPGPTPRAAPHRDLRTTLNNYSQLDVDDLRGALAKLPAVVPPAPPPAEVAKPEVVAATASGDAAKVLPFSTRLLPAIDAGKREAGSSAKTAVNPASELDRNTGFEPATFALARP